MRSFITTVLNSVLGYAIRNVHKNQVELKLNRTHQLVVYGDDDNLLGNKTPTMKNNRETVSDASKETGIEISAEKTICCCHVTRMEGKIMT
jgi:hypothetical protein